MVAVKHICNIKILKHHVVIIPVNQFSMILRKVGHVVIKLYMIGISSKNYQLVLPENIQISNNNKRINFINQILFLMHRMH
jgi:hypothetical protein